MSADKSPKHRNQTKGNQLDQVSHLGGFPASALSASAAAASKQADPEEEAAYRSVQARADESPAYAAAQQASWAAHMSRMLRQSARDIRVAATPTEKLAAFKQAVRAAAREYAESHDKDEFTRCVRDLNFRTVGAAHVVKILISLALDADTGDAEALTPASAAASAAAAALPTTEAASAAASKSPFATTHALLRHLLAEDEITAAHAVHALRQLALHIDDLEIDMPRARAKLLRFVEHGAVRAVFPEPAAGNIARLLRCGKEVTGKARAAIDSLLAEYLINEDLMEAALALEEMGIEELAHEVVTRGVRLAMDRGPRERELISVLIATFSGTELERAHVELAFEVLLESVEDHQCDVPLFAAHLACFAARAVSDEALAPAALDRVNLSPLSVGAEVVRDTFALLAAGDVNPSRLMRIWGAAAQSRPVAELVSEITEILQEYYVSEEVRETMQCVSELNAAYFHHEIVRRAFLLAIDMSARQLELLSRLLEQMHKNNPLSTQVRSGLRRVSACLDDIVLDAPHAPTAFAEIVRRGETDGWLPKGFEATLQAEAAEAKAAAAAAAVDGTSVQAVTAAVSAASL